MNSITENQTPGAPPGPFFSWRHLKFALAALERLRGAIYTALFIAALSFVFCFIYPDPVQNLVEEAVTQHLRTWFQTVGHSACLLFLFIFINNSIVMYLSMSLGVLLGLFPLLTLIFNGAVGGVVVRLVLEKHTSAATILLSLPHAFFELTAFFISAALGLTLGFSWFRKNFRRRLKENIITAHLIFAHIIIPLLLIAALIETAMIMLLK